MDQKRHGPVWRGPKLVIALGSAAVLAAGGVAGLYGASGNESSGTDGRAIDTKLAPEAVDLTAKPSEFARSVVRVLPGSQGITQEVRYTEGASDYDVIDSRDRQGEGYDLQVFKKFAPEELNGAGLRKESVADGILWTGAEEENLTSVYYQNAKGTALRIGSNSPSGHPATIDELKALAPIAARAVETAGGLK